MSALTSLSSSKNASYATTLAQTASVKRSLRNVDEAIQTGNLSSAGSILAALMQDDSDFDATDVSSTSSNLEEVIDQQFQALSAAVANNDTKAARAAWTQIKSDLAEKGITRLSDSGSFTTEILARTKAKLKQSIERFLFGQPAGDESAAAPPPEQAEQADNSVSSLTSPPLRRVPTNWQTYRPSGTVSYAVDSSNDLDTIA